MLKIKFNNLLELWFFSPLIIIGYAILSFFAFMAWLLLSGVELVLSIFTRKN